MAERFSFAEISRIELGLLVNRPSLKSVEDGAWVWRFANGFTGRANSVQCHDVVDDADFEARLEKHWVRSRNHGISPQFRVTPLTPSIIVEHLVGQDIKRLEGIEDEKVNSFVHLLEKLPATSVGLRLVDSRGELIGATYGSCCDGIGSIFALIVDPARRGGGYGRNLVGHLQNWLVNNGARDIALQVVANNQVAIQLYQSFGFEEIYKYCYLMGK